MIKVSVIVPIKNSAKYFEETLHSLCGQTLKEIEIICVDDNSQDETLTLLKNLAGKDARVRVISQKETQGAAKCRNLGLKYVTGNSIVFLDSDDYFEPHMLEKAYEVMMKHNADVVTWGYQKILYDVDGYVARIWEKRPKEGVYVPNGDYERMFKGDESIYSPYAWTKLVKRELIMEHQLKFQEIENCNDVFFSATTLFSAKKIIALSDVFVKYKCMRKGSLSCNRENKRSCLIEAFAKTFVYCEKKCTEQKQLSYAFGEFILLDVLQRIQCFKDSIIVREQILEDFLSNELYQKLKELLLDRYKNIFDYMELCIKTQYLKKEFSYCDYMLVKCVQDILPPKKTAIWGCGIKGKHMLDVLENNQLKVNYVVDNSEKVIGTGYKGYVIQDYDDVKNDVEVILASNLNIYEDLARQNIGKEVVNINVV